MKNYLTLSKINECLTCPFKYKWIYLDKKDYKANKELNFGSFVHAVLEEYTKCLVRNHKKIDLESFEQSIKWSWGNVYSQILSQEDYDKAYKIIKSYINRDIEQENIMSCESWFNFYINELLLKVSGKFDRIDKFDNGDGIVMIDYKTGKDRDIKEDDFGVILYGYALMELFPLYKKHKLEYHILESGRIISPPIMDKAEARKIIIEKSKLVLDEKEFKPKENMFCNWCYIKTINQCSVFSKGDI
ncbi:MAG: PD-(D/E)XK nuclease family protein [Candidatus Nanoarchaeia archaeon]|nr:PD-(D/E)XK nuclease family protein [Candidatus Nanoarchaeia archaeon]